MAVGTSLEQPRTIKIRWPRLNIMITAVMTERNPSLTNLLFEKLPYRSLQSHALVSGDHLYHLVPAEALIVCSPVLDLPGLYQKLTSHKVYSS